MTPDTDALKAALVSLVNACWAACDGADEGQIPVSGFDALSAALDRIEALIPDSEKPCWPGVSIRLFADSIRAGLPCADCRGFGFQRGGACLRCGGTGKFPSSDALAAQQPTTPDESAAGALVQHLRQLHRDALPWREESGASTFSRAADIIEGLLARPTTPDTAPADEREALLRIIAGHEYYTPELKTDAILAAGFRRQAWRPFSERPPFDQRPFRQFVHVTGWKEHSGQVWARDHFGIAYIRPDDAPDGLFGFKREDMERLRVEGDMDGIDGVPHWMPAIFPTLPTPPAEGASS